ncbi:uncharacterized protein LOC125769319 isoform X3 [Anopheles funestus]|uniref:uncharacterized protein LOC125769319 isoform X3 n=1 Tax=Anopheles funestus TaxID=62324 RepID=UPI0020C6D5A1|nr:uncharacterized protein LOC125769319 isoform X3 [Anopheles funestus]
MAGYLRQKAKKITSSKYSSELQENRKPIPGTTIANTTDSIADRARFLQNPAILDTLDTVHRSLLLNNLKFDTDEHAGLGGSSITDYSTLPGNQGRPKEELLESSTANTRKAVCDQTHLKVNIAEASTDVRLSRKQEILQEDLHHEGCGIADSTNEYASLDDELEALFGKDWNNNINGEGTERTSKVKMMVQQYEQKKDKVSRPVRTSAPTVGVDTAELCTDLAHPDVSSFGDVETSDFESASVTSGSSVCGDGGRRSVRTSSAFSEGSRDIASIDRFDMGIPTSRQQKQQEDLAGHNTMITININYRCDTNTLRTSKATCAEKAVDIMVSAPPQAVTGTKRKSLDNEKAITQQAAERHALSAAEIEEEDLMDLEQKPTMTDELKLNKSEDKTNKVLMEDAGSESMTDCMPKEHRGSLTNNRSCRTPDDEEYHDCDDLHESTLSFYEQAFSQPVTPQESKKRSSGVHASSGSSVECENDKLNGEQPMIQIVQELSEDHSEVTSKITLSKAQIRDMQKAYGARRSVDTAEELKRHSSSDEMGAHEKHEKRRKSLSNVTTKKRHDKSNLQRQQRIMDDNFCNEILDSTIHFDRLYGKNHPGRPVMEEQDIVSSPSPARPRAEECFSDSVVCEIASPGEESFDSVMSVGKLEGKPRYSGRTVGRLMMKRLKKLQSIGAQKMLDTSDASTSSSHQMSGPKKPPRTFANTAKRSTALPVPSCPLAKDVEERDPFDRAIGWNLDTKPRSHQVGWTVPASNGKNESIPAQIYSMLNYSEDEGRKQLIKTGNSKPAPQQSISSKGKSKYRTEGEPLGPKLEIDTVDGTRTPSRRHSTSTDFERFVRESNVKSTPHRKSDVCSRIETRRRIEQFLSEERHQVTEVQRKLPGVDRRRRTTGGIFERRRQQQENFLDDARRTNHEPRRKKISKGGQVSSVTPRNACCPAAAATIAGTTSRTNGKVEKRRTFRKAAILKRTRTLFEASKKKIWAMKRFETPKKQNNEEESREEESSLESLPEETPIIYEPLIVRERVEDRLAFRKEHEHFQQNPPASTSSFRTGRYKGNQEDLFSFEKDIIVEENMGGRNVKAGVESGVGVGQNLIVLKAHKSVQVKVDGNGAAPLGCFDTDGEIDSLRKYDDREIEELVHSLHDNVTLSDMGTLDTETTASSLMGNELDNIGYDTVDLAQPVSRSYRQPVRKNLTIDTVDVSELISHVPDDSLSTGNLSPITSSPSSGKMSTSGTAVMRNLKDKLRSSFRKSRTFIKNERQRIANYLLEDRSGSKSSSAASSPRRHTVQKTHANPTGTKQDRRTSDRRKQESDIESDDMYQSFTQGSNSIATGSSMTELSSQHMNELMQQIIRQGDARKQLKQALAICRSTREFECSPELIEAERLLLVATQKETAVRNELNKIDYLTNGMTLAEGKRVGTVTLSNFEFPLKETAVRDAMFNYFYVVVCTYKHEVKATIAKERYTDGRVYFRNCAIQFKNLDANYEIKVEVFVLQLRKNVKSYSFESRYHLDKDSKRPLSCPSPSKKLREAGRMLSFRSNSPKTFDFDNEFSRFKSQGFLSLTSFMLITANGTEEQDASGEAGEEKPFDATYATARSNHTTQMSTMLETGNSYCSTSGNFQPVVCRQDGQSVVFIVEDFKYLTLDSMAYTSNMVGKIGMNVRSEVRFECSDMSGFLDVGEKVDGDEGITWSRRWCQMNGFVLEFWNYPQECQEKQPILYIDLVKCINESIELADRSICSRPRTVRVEIFSSRVAAVGVSCNSSGIGSFRSSGRTTSPSSVGEPTGCGSDLRPISPNDGGRCHNNVTSFLLAADTQSDLKGWLSELNRVVKFLKEWKI